MVIGGQDLESRTQMSNQPGTSYYFKHRRTFNKKII